MMLRRRHHRETRNRGFDLRICILLPFICAIILILSTGCLLPEDETPGLAVIQPHAGVSGSEPFDCDQAIRRVQKRYNIPSLSACILRKNGTGVWETVWKEDYGYRMFIWPRIPIGQDTIYPACSITKMFTATALMQLVEQGLVDLDTDISTYLGFAVRNPGLPETLRQRPVTLRHLLSHRSGLNYPPLDFFLEHKDLAGLEFGIFRNPQELKAYLNREESWAFPGPDGKQRVYYQPGEHYCYTNTGYLAAGFIIEAAINHQQTHRRAQSLTWMDYLRENILEPLGMRHSAFTWHAYSIWQRLHRAQGYIENAFAPVINPDYPRGPGGEPITGVAFYRPGIPMPRYILTPAHPPVRNATLGFSYNAGGPAGQLLSTADDLAKFFVVQLNGGKGYVRDRSGAILYDNGKPREVRILSEGSVAAMHNLTDPGLAKIDADGKDAGSLSALYTITHYGMGWMRVHWGGRFWNGPWNPDINQRQGVRWDILHPAGIKRSIPEGGLDVEGHGGDMPGYHTGMFRVSERLAIIYLMNENFSNEQHDESRMQPKRFKHFLSRAEGAPPLTGLDGALPHNMVKFSEIEYLLLRKAASLK